MLISRFLLALVVIGFIVGFIALTGDGGVAAQDKKKEKDPRRQKKGDRHRYVE